MAVVTVVVVFLRAHSSKNILFDGISRQAASSWADIKESNELGKSECFWQSDSTLMLCQRYKLIMLRARPGPQPARDSIWKSGTLDSICILFCSDDQVRWLDRHHMTAASNKIPQASLHFTRPKTKQQIKFQTKSCCKLVCACLCDILPKCSQTRAARWMTFFIRLCF